MALKYANNVRRKVDKFGRVDRKVRISFDKIMLSMFIGYLSIDSKYITRANYLNLNKLFEIVDTSMYEADVDMYDMISFIKLMLEARLVKKMETLDVILSYCTRSGNENYKKFANMIDTYANIKESEIRYINRAVIDRLKYAYIVFYKDIIYADFEKIDTGEFESFEEVNNIIKDDITHLMGEMRGAESLVSLDTFSLSDEVFETVVTDVVAKLKDKSRCFTTGIRALNKILSPGFLSGRLYLFLGLTGGFKSGILLTIAKWMKYYNADVLPKRNPESIPTILFISNENSVAETVARLFNMTVPGVNLEDLTPEEVIRRLKEEGHMTINNENGVDLMIQYYNDRQIDTNDLYGIIEDIENDGREVMALILDYIKRIRASESGHGDERIELKNASNELKSLAQNLDIPVITAMQINRAGNANVEMGMSQSKEDLARFLGATNVANCWDLIENSDWVCIINKEKRKDDDTWYLTFKRTKIRYADKSNGVTYFNHPFADGDAIRLIDDIFEPKSLSLESLASNLEGSGNVVGRKGHTSVVKRKEVAEVAEEQADAFDLERFAAGRSKVA